MTSLVFTERNIMNDIATDVIECEECGVEMSEDEGVYNDDGELLCRDCFFESQCS